MESLFWLWITATNRFASVINWSKQGIAREPAVNTQLKVVIPFWISTSVFIYSPFVLSDPLSPQYDISSPCPLKTILLTLWPNTSWWNSVIYSAPPSAASYLAGHQPPLPSPGRLSSFGFSAIRFSWFFYFSVYFFLFLWMAGFPPLPLNCGCLLTSSLHSSRLLLHSSLSAPLLRPPSAFQLVV